MRSDSFQTALVIALGALSVLSSLLFFPLDDGLRHIGLAFGEFSSWGDVYPFSTFAELKGYDPWFGYDRSLEGIARLARHLPIPTLTLEFLLTKALMLFFGLAFLALLVRRSGLLEVVRDGVSFTLAIILILLWCSPFLSRLVTVRPFIFGTLYLLYCLGGRKFLAGALAAAALALLYPYLAWFYVVPVAVVHLFKGSRRFAAGGLFVLALFLVLQPQGFWQFQAALLGSGPHRNAITTVQIGEFISTLQRSYFYLVLAVTLAVFPSLPREARRLNQANLLLLIYLLPGLMYCRYFADAVLPLAFVSFARPLVEILRAPFQTLLAAWRNIFLDEVKPRLRCFRRLSRKAVNPSPPGGARGTEWLRRVLLGLGYLMLLAYLIQGSATELTSLAEYRELLADIPKGEIILSSFNMQYKTLFVRPDLRIIPSSELGFAAKEIREPYQLYFNEGQIQPLAAKTGARFFVEDRDIQIDPQEGRHLELMCRSEAARVWRIVLAPAGASP